MRRKVSVKENTIKSKRLELDSYFHTLTDNVYFQPPPSVHMEYPAIRYRRTALDHMYGDNGPYITATAYEVIVIDKNPDSEIVEAISRLPLCRHIRFYTADNLNHDVFIIYK